MDNIYLYYIIVIILLLLIICITIILTAKNKDDVEQMDLILGNNDPFPFPVYIINLERKPERFNYVVSQLNKMGIKNYQKWVATDGFKIDINEMIKDGIEQKLINNGLGLAGCASSHIRLWKHIAGNKLGWTLILEDDVHFHPEFINLFYKYWKRVPIDAKIIFPGYFDFPKNDKQIVIEQNVMCLHGYMLNHEGAKYLLDNLLPMDEVVDYVITEHFRNNYGSFIFNGRIKIGDIIPDDYKMTHGDQCMFNGIIYQNREEYGRTIYSEYTTFNNHY